MFFRNGKREEKMEKEKKKETSTTPSCSGPIPAQKIEGNSAQVAVFSHLMPKKDFYYFHHFSWGKKNAR